MRRFVIFSTIILAYLSLGCSDIRTTPSAIVLKHYEARQNADIQALRLTMTREAYLDLVGKVLNNTKNEGKVFAYDRTHFRTDPVSMRRLEERLTLYFKDTPRPTIKLLSEKAPDEHSREIYLEVNGKMRVIGLVDIDSQWKISRIPGD